MGTVVVIFQVPLTVLQKGELYLASMKSNDLNHYKMHGKILSNVFKEAKLNNYIKS